jgi:organic hydroperoxide reductase OsmC/OhrA
MKFPIEYDVDLGKTDSEPTELRSGHRPVILTGPPPEFGGTDMVWSPEHLLVSAAASCMTATFLAAASRASLRVGALRCRAKGYLDRSEGRIAFSEMDLAFTIHVLAEDVAKANKLFEESKRHCFVANSLACTVNTTVEVLS